LSHDADSLEAHLILSEVHSSQLRHDQALVAIDRALALNPSDAASHSQRGNILLWAGRTEEAVAELETAFTLDPGLPPGDAFSLGLAYYTARRHDDAVRFLEREALRNPDYLYFPVLLAAAYAELGRATDAKRAAEAAKRWFPVIDPTTFGSRFRNPADHDYLVDGLRKAGLI
jgi:adenylate cyclase